MTSTHSLRSTLPALLVAMLLAGCGHSPAAGITTQPTTGQPASGPSNSWTWAAGSNVAGAWGSYGTLGTGTAATAPGARSTPVTWRDDAGALWLFGGLGFDSTGAGGSLDDLWKFTPSTSTWTWIGGSSTVNNPGNWGTLGVAVSTSHPSARSASSGWSDAAGNAWLFGGNGLASSGSGGMLADLWEYTGTSGLWTWVAGPNSENTAGVYGVLGVAAAANAPGGRSSAATWRDAAGNLWMFGGVGYDAAGMSGSLNDLWKFDAVSGQWTWVSGASVASAAGQYGVVGVATSSSAPGARYGAVSWIDAAGNLWLFGGQGYDISGSNGALNDLWEFNPTTGLWTWVGGSSSVGALGLYGTQGTAASTNVPGARGAAVAWTDGLGAFWMFGGLGVDSAGSGGYLNDLWKYDPVSGLWTFVLGSSLGGVAGTYGTLQAGAAGNVPGARFSAAGWVDSSHALWLLGGQGEDASGAIANLNDLWKYTP